MRIGSRSSTTLRRGTSRALAVAVGIVLAFGVAAPAARAACSLTLILVPCIDVSWPSADVAFGNVAPGTTPTSGEQVINVSANTNWGIKVSADQATGRMKEWTPSGYIFPSPRTMTNPLQWALTSVGGTPQGPSWADLSSTQATVVSGQSHTGCVLNLLCGTRNIGVTYRVRPTFTDRRVAPNSYRLLVTYDAQTGF